MLIISKLGSGNQGEIYCMRTCSSYMSHEQMSSDVHEYAKYSNVYRNVTLGFIVLGKRLSSIFGAVQCIVFIFFPKISYNTVFHFNNIGQFFRAFYKVGEGTQTRMLFNIHCRDLLRRIPNDI